MQTIKATFRITTPMFLSGAEQQRAELRVPSIKGALCFWWRALAFSQYGNDTQRLRNRESALFGGTGTNEGQSRISLRLTEISLKPEVQQRWPPNAWEAYIGYGLIETTGNQSRQYFKSGSRFTLTLAFKTKSAREGSITESDAAQLRTALRALGLLGGLGGRSRKGWGSVQLETLHGLDYEWTAPETVENLQAELTSLFSSQCGDLPQYSAMCTRSRFALGPVQSDAVATHRYLAQRYKEIIRDLGSTSGREQFGLPRKNAGRNADSRRSGPLFLHIHELPNGEAVPVAAFLPARFLPEQRDPDGEWRQVETFLSKVKGTEDRRP